MTAKFPECPSDAKWSYDDQQRLNELTNRLNDIAADTLDDVEMNNLFKLKDRHARFCIYRGEVERFKASQERAGAMPPDMPRDADAVGTALAAMQAGRYRGPRSVRRTKRRHLHSVEERHSRGMAGWLASQSGK